MGEIRAEEVRDDSAFGSRRIVLNRIDDFLKFVAAVGPGPRESLPEY